MVKRIKTDSMVKSVLSRLECRNKRTGGSSLSAHVWSDLSRSHEAQAPRIFTMSWRLRFPARHSIAKNIGVFFDKPHIGN
jgi:hypothetical protein